MKNKIRSLIIVTLLTMVSMDAWSQAVGDYGSVASSAYSDVATWKKWDGTGFTTAATVVPTATDNVWIRGGFTVTISSSPARCKNLIIGSDGTLIGSTVNPSSSQVYIRVSGDSIRNDGYFGVTAAAPTTYTAIGIEPYIPGGTLRLTGNGTTKLSRIRNGSGIHFTTVVIDHDVFLSYNGSTGGGGSAWYGDNGSGVGSTLKINAGKKLTVTDGGAIATSSSVDADGPRTTIQVDGTLSLPGANSTMSLRPAKDTGAVNLIVNGLVEVGRTFKPTGTVGGGSVTSIITVNAGGILKFGTASAGITYFHNPLQTVTGNGTVQFVGGTLQIGAPAGLDPANGPIRTATRTFSATGGYTFLGKNQSTGSDFPATVGDLTISDTGTVTLTNNVTVNGTLSLNFGSLVANGKTMAFGPAGAVAYNDTTTATTTTDLEFPAVNGPKKVTLNNFKGMTLHASRTIDTLVLTNGIVSVGANTMTVNNTAVGGGAGKFVNGKLPYMVSAAGMKKWETGQGTDYLPFTARFNNVTGSDIIAVTVNDRNTVAPLGTYTSGNKLLRRYFRVNKGAGITAFATDSLVLTYANADVVEQGVTDENTLRVYKHDGTALSAVTISGRDTAANTITVTGVSSFADFIITGAEIAPPSSGSVTFQVNMKVQSRIKKFDPAKDTVIVRGDFYQGVGNWWEANDLKLKDADGDSIFTGTFNVGTVPKRLGKFKYVLRGPSFVGDRWEIDMGANKDRTDTIPSTPWTLPVVWFDYDSTSNQILVPPMLPINFEAANVEYSFTNFSGATTTRIPNPQSSGINTSGFVAKTVKGAGDPWAGSFLTLDKPIDFKNGMIFKVKVFMPKVGAKLLFKVENLTNGAFNKEIDVVATKANEWEELTYDFSSLDTTKTYQKIVLIFDLGTVGDGSANFTYLVDDIRLMKAAPTLPLTFESNGVDFSFTNFSGATTTRVANPSSTGINTSGFVAKTIKGAGDPWAGSFLTLNAPVDLSKRKIFKAKVFMPKVGAKMLFKLENLTDGSINKELEAIGTKANAWEELAWDFSTIDTSKKYQKVVVIFDLGTVGDGGPNFTYYFDDIKQDSVKTNVRRDDLAAVTQYELLQNYPNPFNPSTTIAFSILKDGWTSLKIFNVVGQEVATVVNQHLSIGRHIATFNASHLTSGVYFYTLETGSFKSIKKMLLLK